MYSYAIFSIHYLMMIGSCSQCERAEYNKNYNKFSMQK